MIIISFYIILVKFKICIFVRYQSRYQVIFLKCTISQITVFLTTIHIANAALTNNNYRKSCKTT